MLFAFFSQMFKFAGSLCLLLFGMNMLSNGIQKGAGAGLQKLLSKMTGNRIKAVLTGLGITAIIQSSGATTVMAVSFVNAEILTLEQAIGVIFGANIGTTVTAWIVSFFGFNFSVASMAIPIFGIGFILKYLKKFRIHNFADCFMGFALLFMGLGLLKESLSIQGQTTKILTAVTDWGIWGILTGVLIGIIVTALIHSSSAMTAIVLTMAANNTLSWQLSAAIVLGSNIGSTIDAIMSSVNASTNARRTALVHVGFNLAGTIIALCFFSPFLALIDFIVPGTPAQNITTHIAMLHSVFNICATLIFLPFVNQIAALSRKIIADPPDTVDAHYKIPAILPFSNANADIYGIQIQKEISKMAAKIMEMFDIIVNFLQRKSDLEKETQRIENLENYIDEMDDSIVKFLQKCFRLPTANAKDREHFLKLIHLTDSLENLSDECCSVIHSLQKFSEKSDKKNFAKRTAEILNYTEQVRVFFEQSIIYFTIGFNTQNFTKKEKQVYNKMLQQIDETKKELKKASRKRIENGADVKSELQYIDIIKKIERLKFVSK